MPADHNATTSDQGDDEERDVQAMADSLREGLKDPSTRKHMRRLTKAAMGDEPDDAATPDAPEQP